MVSWRPGRVGLLCALLSAGFVLSVCGNGCAKPAPHTPTRADSPTARKETPVDMYMGEPQLGDEEP